MTAAAERQTVARELAAWQALVTATPPGRPPNFLATHTVASRPLRAAYEGWKKVALAAIASTSRPQAVGEGPRREGRPDNRRSAPQTRWCSRWTGWRSR